jgi:glycosyltransferase involved in cell wall biosynthesis
MPAVSVIIPAYNGVSRYLGQSIESVLAQTFKDIEVIVVDDASIDETARLVASYPEIRYVRRAVNGGQAAARNEGARLATGRFLAFLDQDDLWEPAFLEETLQVADMDKGAAIIHTDGYQVNERNEVLSYDHAMKRTGSITQLLRGGHDVATSGSLFRRACFEAVGGYDEQLTIWEDIDLAIRLSQSFKIMHLPKPLYRHRLYGHNASREIPSARALLGRQRFLEKHAGSCRKGTAVEKALKRDLAHYYSDLGKHYFREGRIREARRAFREAIRQQPFNHKIILRWLRSHWANLEPPDHRS